MIVKRTFVFAVITVLLATGILLYVFPASVTVKDVKSYNITKDADTLNYLLKESGRNFNPQKEYFRILYTVSVRPHLPILFQFNRITFKQLSGNFRVILLKPGIKYPAGYGGYFRERLYKFYIVVEAPEGTDPKTIISNVEFAMHAYKCVTNPAWKKHPEQTSCCTAYPAWPTLKVKAP